jgi:hypothetical protein
MTPNPQNAETKMSGIKGFIGRKMSKKVKFMGEEVLINKLSVAQVLEIQEVSKDLKEEDEDSYKLVHLVIQYGVEGGEDLTMDELSALPLDELSTIANEIMKYSGVSQGK